MQRAAGDAADPVVSNYVNKEDIKTLGTDIRYIYTGSLPAPVPSNPLRESIMQYRWLGYLLPAVIACILFIVFHKRIKENADTTRLRYKQANKVAKKRLKKAAALLRNPADSQAFYAEIEKALWTYLSDRLSVPTADLNKDNIASILRAKQVGEDLVANVHKVLAEAEFARYAPPSGDHAREDLYTAATRLINTLEDQKL